MDIGDIKYLGQPAKVLKLSEAIRIGAKIRPQCTGKFYANGGSCAIGAALEAIGMKGEVEKYRRENGPTDPYHIFDKAFPYASALDLEIGMKSDNGTREKVADWLQSLGY